MGTAAARAWLVEIFPTNFVLEGPEDDATPEDRAQMSAEDRAAATERDGNRRLVLAPGASMPTDAAVRAALSLASGDPIPSDPEAMVASARAAASRCSPRW